MDVPLHSYGLPVLEYSTYLLLDVVVAGLTAVASEPLAHKVATFRYLLQRVSQVYVLLVDADYHILQMLIVFLSGVERTFFVFVVHGQIDATV